MIELQELVYNPKKGRDVMTSAGKLDFDPQAYKTKANAAKACFEAVKKLAAAHGQNPEIEVALHDPAKSKEMIGYECWRVIWEAGPFEWAIGASMEITGPWGYTEPYYSFDLCFTE